MPKLKDGLIAFDFCYSYDYFQKEEQVGTLLLKDFLLTVEDAFLQTAHSYNVTPDVVKVKMEIYVYDMEKISEYQRHERELDDVRLGWIGRLRRRSKIMWHGA